jgi:hypothetical protein
MNSEGYALKGEHGREPYADVTANSNVLKQQSAAVYKLYKTISSTICVVIDNLKGSHEELTFRFVIY